MNKVGRSANTERTPSIYNVNDSCSDRVLIQYPEAGCVRRTDVIHDLVKFGVVLDSDEDRLVVSGDLDTVRLQIGSLNVGDISKLKER